MKKRMMSLALLGLLAGCGSAPTSLHYYSLDTDNQPAPTVAAQPQHQLVLRPVALSGQLDKASLVYQLAGNELHFAEYHRWAGSLDGQLNQLTLNGLSSRLPGWVIRQDGARKGPVLTISVERFQGRHDGRAVLSGRWRLLTEEGTVLRDMPFQQVRVLPDDGYGPLVDELGQGWQQLLDQIAADLRKRA
ncbi:ABC-type transport auxiliary lipoprotein family protein [Aeromonas encheleia]|uniref:PqiC family protein n=1 Tax=Aeromonas TaxID=642 RepID=UPI001C451C3F|nr:MULTISPECIES: ABC-type transport auxiliary lipoprotein family protein [Aeromonas]MBV7598524.1 membrane integrity-associated transporter subunit PqiC [Aeromonas sp. sia0103]UNP88943.1 ABC-type transport auxiliary lipoprotein family protein [Aeromonas encheleia]